MVRGRRTQLVIRITCEEQRILTAWQRSTTIQAGLARRGRIILLLAEGQSISHIARTVGIRRRFVYKWAARFLEQGIDGLYDKTGRGRSSNSASSRSTPSRDGPDGDRIELEFRVLSLVG